MVVTGRVSSVGDIERVGGVFLCCSAGEVSLALLCHHILDVAFARLEIVAHRGGLIFRTVLSEHRFALHLACTVRAADCENGVVGQIHPDLGRGKFDVAVLHIAVTVHESGVALYDQHGVLRREYDRILKVHFHVFHPRLRGSPRETGSRNNKLRITCRLAKHCRNDFRIGDYGVQHPAKGFSRLVERHRIISGTGRGTENCRSTKYDQKSRYIY